MKKTALWFLVFLLILSISASFSLASKNKEAPSKAESDYYYCLPYSKYRDQVNKTWRRRLPGEAVFCGRA